MVTQLIESGISVNVVDYNIRTVLHVCAENGHENLVEYLLTKSAIVDSRDKHGDTAIKLAIRNNHHSIVEILKSAGAAPPQIDTIHFKSKRSMNASFAVMEAFPHSIAAAMLEGRKIKPIFKEMVSLLFADIVGFTTLSSTMEAGKVSDMLSRLFNKFDKLAYIHGVQKIDVIGDAYIAATNFMEDQGADHAARLARFAVDAMKAARETRIADDDAPALSGLLQLRIGLHCGPVSGGIVGSQGLKYTLMGDTVNMASRMESTCASCRIQCSEAFALLVGEQAHEIILKPR